MTFNWHKVEVMPPPQRELVVVTGPSGYTTHDRFLELAYVDDEYRPPIAGIPRWQTVTHDALSDRGFYPTHWARQPNWPEAS